MNQNENMSVEITLTEENESSTAMYDLSPEDFAALTATATVLDLDIGYPIEADTCVCCPERAEHWFQLQVIKNAKYSFSADVCVGARLYDAYGNLLASDNDDGEKNGFLIDYELDEWTGYYLRVMPNRNHFMRFNTVIANTAISVESISVSPNAVTLMPGETVTLSATVVPENATWWRLIWSSSDNNVARVDYSNCVVTAVSPGTATISAKTLDGSSKTISCTVTVVNLKENVEYHLLCNGDSTKALRIGMANVFELTVDLPARGEKKSYWKRQKWVLKSDGANKKLFTQLDTRYYLCNNGSNESYVSDSASDNNSNIVIIPCAKSSDLYEIKLANSDLYLTLEYNSSDNFYWAKWRSKSASNSSNQVWQFVEQPANLHNGVDTGSILNETMIQALKADGTEFVIRYYKILDNFADVEFFTKGFEYYNGEYIPKLDATILKLQVKEIDLDVDDYFVYANDSSLGESNLYTDGAGKSLTPDERDLYKDLNIVSVYQNFGDDYECFTEKHAKLDALSALLSAKILGQPQGTAIYFAVDYDATTNQLERIRNYFNIIKNKIGGRYKIGVYGNGLVCSTIKPEFASYSWLSHSTGDKGTESYQHYENYDDTTKYNIKQAETYYCNGIKVDDDVAVGNDYGQWDV